MNVKDFRSFKRNLSYEYFRNESWPSGYGDGLRNLGSDV